MPMGKIRSKQRSSSNSSYASTVTTIVFIALCILGAWMLTSNSFFSPETNTRIVTSTKLPNSLKTDTTPAFEDNPGDLPDDAIKPDKQDSELEKGDVNKQENGGGNDVGKLSANLMDPAKVSGSVVKDKNAIVEENPVGLRGEMSLEEQEKQKELETQTSEESTMTIQSVQEVAIENIIEPKHESKPKEEKKEVEKINIVDKPDIGKENVGQERKPKEEKKDVEKISNQPNIGKEEIGKAEEEKKIQPDIGKEEIGKESKAKEEKKIQPDIRKKEVGKESNAKEEKKEEKKIQPDIGKEEVSSKESMAKEEKKEVEKIEAKPHELTEEEQEHRMEQHRRQEEENSHGTTSGDQIEHDESRIDGKNDEVKPVTGNQGEVVVHNENEKYNANLNTKQMKDDSFSTSVIPKESKESKESWSTQAHQSENQKERRYTWQLCNVTAGADYIPCLDNEKAIKKLPSRGHYEHRERHCPEEPPTCLVRIPEGYKKPVEWPHSRNKIWYHNVPHTLLAEVKGHQNWVKVTGEFLTFPGGGTQFIHGALHYIDFIQEAVPEIAWGKHTRVVLDVGCGVASFGGYLFDRDVVTMSFAPKDEHEAQVQFALERGIPAISAVMGTQRLPFPSRVFDLVHCARCRVPWHIEGGALLLELNRVLRPGGYFVWSATPVYQKLEEDVQIWKEMSALTVSMCWELVTIKKDKLNSIGAAIYQKPESNECYDARKHNRPPMCKPDDDPNAAWYVPLQSCIHKIPIDERERGSQWPEEWPRRLQTPPYWLNKTQNGIYGKLAPEDFAADFQHWKHVVKKSYLKELGITWSDIRNVMDMRAVYGGFAAAMKEHNVWVMNVVNVNSPDTLPIIYERGLFGIYHDWCESFSTYPRTYDLLHADHLFFKLKTRCKLVPVMAEVDRIVRPGGRLIVRDETAIIGEVENILKSLNWEVHLTLLKNNEGILSAQKSYWRPDTYAPPS